MSVRAVGAAVEAFTPAASDAAAIVAARREAADIPALFARIEAVTDKPNEAITLDDLAELADIERLPRAMRPYKPRGGYPFSHHLAEGWLPTENHESKRTFDLMRTWVATERRIQRGDTPADAVAEALEIVRSGRTDSEAFEALEAIKGLPPHLQPVPTPDEAAVLQKTWIDLALAPEIGAHEVARLAVLESLPESFRLRLPDRRSVDFRFIHMFQKPLDERHAMETIEHARTWATNWKMRHEVNTSYLTPSEQLAQLVAGDTYTQLDYERMRAIYDLEGYGTYEPVPGLQKIVDDRVAVATKRSWEELPDDEMRRLATIEGLPESMGIERPELERSFSDEARNGSKNSYGERISSLREWRRWSLERQLLRDPATTPTSVQQAVEAILHKESFDWRDVDFVQTVRKLPASLQPQGISDAARGAINTHLARIADQSPHEVTPEAARIAGLVDALPPAMRPVLPEGNLGLERMMDDDLYAFNRSPDVVGSWLGLRRHVYFHSDKGQAVIRRAIERDKPLDPWVIQQLLHDEASRARVGVTLEQLTGRLLASIQSFSDVRWDSSEAHSLLDSAWKHVKQLPQRDETSKQLLDEASNLLKQNVDRASARRYLNYQEIAKAMANVELVEMLHGSRSATIGPTW